MRKRGRASDLNGKMDLLFHIRPSPQFLPKSVEFSINRDCSFMTSVFLHGITQQKIKYQRVSIHFCMLCIYKKIILTSSTPLDYFDVIPPYESVRYRLILEDRENSPYPNDY